MIYTFSMDLTKGDKKMKTEKTQEKARPTLDELVKKFNEGYDVGFRQGTAISKAAPELLAAVKEINRQVYEWRQGGSPDMLTSIHLQDRLRALIRRAEGSNA